MEIRKELRQFYEKNISKEREPLASVAIKTRNNETLLQCYGADLQDFPTPY